MRSRTLVVLLAVVAALGAFIWFYERELPSTEEREQQSKKLVDFDAGSVRSIELVARNQRVLLERVENRADGATEASASRQWRLAEPLQGRADQQEVEAFLERLGELEKLRTLEDASAGQVGLDHPRAQLELVTASGAIGVRFGGEIPASENTVVEVDGAPPYFVVSGDLVGDIARAPDSWRSRDALAYDKSEIETLEILDPAGGVVLQREGAQFRLRGPFEDLADSTRVSELLQALADLEIEKFLDADSDVDFESAPVAVRLTIAGVPEPVVVQVGRFAEGESNLSKVRVDGEWFEAETNLASLVDRDPGQWRSTDWSSLQVFEIEGFRITRRGGGELTFERRDGDWLLGEREVEYSVVGDLLRAVTGAKGAPIDGEASGLAENPEVEIELRSGDGSETLRLWSAEDTPIVERAGRATRLALDGNSEAELSRALERLEAAAEEDVGGDDE